VLACNAHLTTICAHIVVTGAHSSLFAMLPSDFKWQPRAKRKLAADKENHSANSVRDVSQPGVRMVDAAGPTKKAKVAEGSLSDAERKPAAKRVHSLARARMIAVFLIAGESDVKGVVDGAEVVRRVPVVRVQLQERPPFCRAASTSS
jgi:hypothetical protein